MLHKWPDDSGLAREILLAEQEGDRITHDIVRRVNTTVVTPIDGEDIYALATKVDDIVDFTEETADFLGLYQIEAPMEQAQAMADVLVKACEQLAAALAGLRDSRTSSSTGSRSTGSRTTATASTATRSRRCSPTGIDPMVVIRWKDLFAVLERAIDATETAAHILEGIVIKNS